MRGEKNEAATGLCLFLPPGPHAGKIKGGLGLCSQGLGGPLNGVTLWEGETWMGHTASVWGPAPPPLAFAPSNTAAWAPKRHSAAHRCRAPSPGQASGLQSGAETWAPAAFGGRRSILLVLQRGHFCNFPGPEAGSQLLPGALMSPWVTATYGQVLLLRWGPGPLTREWGPCGHLGLRPGAAEKGKATRKQVLPYPILVGPGTPSARR